jgi:Flp pilus assembly protein TadG
MIVQPKTAVLGRGAGERGATLLEFVITASIFFMMLVGIVAISHLYFTHNALEEATRRGARFATFKLNNLASSNEIKNMVVYGTTTQDANSTSLVSGLTTTNVVVERAGFGVGTGSVTVRIQNYNYSFVIPGLTTTITMPEYRTTLTGECAGYIPSNIGG